MHIKICDDKSIVTLSANDLSEESLLRRIIKNKKEQDILEYDGRKGAEPADGLNKKMILTFIISKKQKLHLSATSDESEMSIRSLRNAIFFGGQGLILLGHSYQNGTLLVNFCVSLCQHCHGPMVRLIDCESKTCRACAEKCEHNYRQGLVHDGGAVNLGLGIYCSKCGRGKPGEKPIVLNTGTTMVIEAGIKNVFII